MKLLIRGIVLLLFRPERFVQVAKEHDAGPPQGEPATGEALTRERVRRIRFSLASGFGWVFVALVLGWIFGLVLLQLVGPPTRAVTALLQVIATGIILGATLSVLGWEIQSYTGQTLPEKVNRCLYRASYVFGTFLLILSISFAP